MRLPVPVSTRAHPIVIEPLDRSEEAISAWVAVQEACRLADIPSSTLPNAARIRGELEHPWPDRRVELWAARVDGRTTGLVTLHMRLLDNTDVTAIRELNVHPDYRRRGIGTALWRQAIDRSRAAGRHRLLAETTRPLDRDRHPGELFVAAMGAARVSTHTRRHLAVDGLDDARLRRQLAGAEAASPDYSLVRWVGPTPDGYVEPVALMTSQMSIDVPRDDLAWQPEAWGSERIRSRDAVATARGIRAYTTAARHDPTGKLAGFTTLDFPAGNYAFGWQEDTLVLPEHRGHRLGLRLKIENLFHVRVHEPALRIVDTSNADANSHMIAINSALGFRPVSRHCEWELALEEG